MAQGDIISSINHGTVEHYCVGISFDNSVTGVGFENGDVNIFDMQTGDLLLNFSQHANIVKGIAFHPKKSQVLTVAEDELAILWDYVTGDIIFSISGLTYGGRCCDFSHDGSKFVYGAHYSVHWVETETGDEINNYNTWNWITDVKFSHDDSKLAIASSSYHDVINVSTANLITKISHGSYSAYGCDFTLNDKYLLGGNNKSDLYKLEISTGNIVNSVNLNQGSIDDIDCGNYNNISIVTTGYSIIILNNLDIPNPIFQKEFGRRYNKSQISNDDKRIVTIGNIQYNNYNTWIWESGYSAPVDVILTMPGYYSSSITASDITKESTTEMDGYYSNPITFDMARIVDIFRKILNGKITTKSNLQAQIKKEQHLKATIKKEGDLN